MSISNATAENSSGIGTIIEQIVDAQHVMGYCSTHLTGLIKNGKVKNRFSQMSRAAIAHRDILERFCSSFGLSCRPPQKACKFCDVKPESFSLIGALNIGVEVSTYLFERYRALASLVEDPGDRKIFREMAAELGKQRTYLKAEQKFAVGKQEEDEPTYMESSCMPQIISRLCK